MTQRLLVLWGGFEWCVCVCVCVVPTSEGRATSCTPCHCKALPRVLPFLPIRPYGHVRHPYSFEVRQIIIKLCTLFKKTPKLLFQPNIITLRNVLPRNLLVVFQSRILTSLFFVHSNTQYFILYRHVRERIVAFAKPKPKMIPKLSSSFGSHRDTRPK